VRPATVGRAAFLVAGIAVETVDFELYDARTPDHVEIPVAVK
jgi:hypothetical protein